MRMQNPDKTAHALWVGMAVAVMAVIGAIIYLNGRPVAEGALGCLKGSPANRIAILMDKSDPFTPAQQDELMLHFERIQAEFQINDLVSIFLLSDPEAMSKKPAFAHCVPQREANAAYAAPLRVAKKYADNFGKPFGDTVQEAIQASEAAESPLLEMIRRISRSSYFKEESGKARKLYVISDMMQHGPAYSFYKQEVSFEKFQESEFGKKVMDDSALKGVNVELILIPRQSVPFERMQEVKRFWIDYLRRQGVREVKVSPLP